MYWGFVMCSFQNVWNHDSFASWRRRPPDRPYDGDMYDGPEPGGAERRAIIIAVDVVVVGALKSEEGWKTRKILVLGE